MLTKSSVQIATSTALVASAFKSQLSASHIPLPLSFDIHFAIFSPISEETGPHDIYVAQQHVLERNAGDSVAECILTHTQLSGSACTFWIFSIEKSLFDQVDFVARSKLERLEFSGLTRTHIDYFSYADIFPCSDACALQRTPCEACTLHSIVSSCSNLSPDGPIKMGGRLSAACHFPRQPLRQPLKHFLDAVRDAICSEICAHALATGKSVKRMGEGVLLEVPRVSSAWTDDWEGSDMSRSLTFCYPFVSLLRTGIHVYPRLIKTAFVTFVNSPSTAPGTPIHLLPFSTPAYFINIYSGETASILKRFQTSLAGLGECMQPKAVLVTAWVAVQNKNGEEKGIIVIWPAELCLSILHVPRQAKKDSHPGVQYAYGREPLSYIPDLPPALQASPVPGPAIRPTTQTFSDTDPPSSSHSPLLNDNCVNQQCSSSFPSGIGDSQLALLSANERLSPETIAVLRNLAFSSTSTKDLNSIAVASGRFVDYLAKERDRERERIRREREAASVPQIPLIQQRTSVEDTRTSTPSISVEVLQKIQPHPTHEDPAIDFTQILPVPGTTLPILNVQEPNFQAPYPSPPEEIEVKRDYDNDQSMSSAVPKTEDEQSMSGAMAADRADFSMDNFMMDIEMGDQEARMSINDSGAKLDLDSFGIFTDDDFNFFDDISSIPPVIPVHEQNAPSALPPAVTDWTSGSDVHAIPIHAFPTPRGWAEADVSPAYHPVFSPTSDHTVVSHGPVTPGIIHSDDIAAVVDDGSPFSALSFDTGLSLLDEKYAGGKFSSFSARKPSSRRSGQWRKRYQVLTDPRWNVIKRLIGVKRKIEELELDDDDEFGIRLLSGSAYSKRSDWDDGSSRALSAGESEESGNEDTDSTEDECTPFDPVSTSRASSPLHLDPYQPLGPSLLSTAFVHGLLLPLSSPLRPPSAPLASLDISAPLPNPVPTPVSPAAMPGVTSERCRSWETFVKGVISELLENSEFEKLWRATSSRIDLPWYPDADVRVRSEIVSGFWPFDALDLSAFLWVAQKPEISTPCIRLEQPSLCVGKAGSLVNMKPSSLPFWSKLGLTPRSGPKDVTVCLLHDSAMDISGIATSWMSRMSAIYNVKGFGTQTHMSNHMTDNGVLQFQHLALRRTLSSLLEIHPSQTPLLIYIVVPASALSLSSPLLRQMMMAIRRALAKASNLGVKMHLLPETVLRGGNENEGLTLLNDLVMETYERLPRPTLRFSSRISTQLSSATRWFKAPAFTLAHLEAPTATLSFNQSASEMSFLEQHCILHVGYAYSKCRRWVFVACIDERGENEDLTAFYVGEEDEEYVLGKVWNFTMKLARQADVEWRIAIAKLGAFGEEELKEWNALLQDNLFASPTMHVLLTCVEEDFSLSTFAEDLSFPPSNPGILNADSHMKHQLLTSCRSAIMIIGLQKPPPPPLLWSPLVAFSRKSCVEEDDFEDRSTEFSLPVESIALIFLSQSSTYRPSQAYGIHLYQTISSPSSSYIGTDSECLVDVCRNLHDLSVLTNARWRSAERFDSPLPYHLLALHVSNSILGISDSKLE